MLPLEGNEYEILTFKEEIRSDHSPSQSGNYLRVTLILVCAIYLQHLRYIFSLIAKIEEVEKLGCKLSGHMWGQYALDTKPSTDSQR